MKTFSVTVACTVCLVAASCSFSVLLYAQQNMSSIKIDFSYSGYKGGDTDIPTIAAVLFVKPGGGDDTKLLQSAINYVGNLPMQKNGFRGALLLAEGRFKVSGQLFLDKSGVVIRGSKKNKTIIEATGIERLSLIEIGNNDTLSATDAKQVINTIVPEGNRDLTLNDLNGIDVGDHVVINRPATANWIADIGMNKAEGMFVDRRGLPWPTGSRELTWDRIVKEIDHQNNQITLDAPITTAIQSIYGGATVRKSPVNQLVHSIGLENFSVESEYNQLNRFDEDHSWIGITVNYAEDVWVRDVDARHFVSSAIRVGQRARRISIMNCICREPISEIGGYRRNSFLVEGQQVLVKDCLSDSGINDFASGFCAGGPNVFLNCKAIYALGASGSFESWASGILYENVTIEGADLRLTYDPERSQGAGWTAANSIIWNSTAKQIEATAPPEYPNQVVTAGYSLYKSQLAKRLTINPDDKPAAYSYKETSAHLREFTPKDILPDIPAQKALEHPLQIVNGRFVMDGKVVWSGITGDQYWRGQAFPAGELNSGISITRYVPGRVGSGLTEDLPKLAQSLLRQGNHFYQSVTGLWYDRRRDDHSTKKRQDGNVWASFYEMPWKRSGKGTAWDGLSKYDLTKYNYWYFKRGKEFARLCDENGLVLYYNLYDTHNLLEYVTHWVDYPWRPVNTINETGLPEPLPVEPWARLHLANEFYNPDNPSLRKLHWAYIFHVLDELGSFRNIIFNLGIQFSGPLKFQRFFLQTVNEWEKQNNRDVRVVLNASKGITDSILSDTQLAKQIDVIDTRYWQYRPDGLFSNSDSLWAPPGGVNRSYREMVGEAFLQETDYPLPTTQELTYRQVREYTDKFPGKAVVSVYNEVSPIASLMAGGAQVLMQNQKERTNGHITFGSFVQQYLGDILMNMKPVGGLLENEMQNWCLADGKKRSLLVYSLSGPAITFTGDVSDASYTGVWFDPLSERILPLNNKVKLKNGSSVKKPSKANWLLLLRSETHL